MFCCVSLFYNSVVYISFVYCVTFVCYALCLVWLLSLCCSRFSCVLGCIWLVFALLLLGFVVFWGVVYVGWCLLLCCCCLASYMVV